jgi:hypothetical protein
VTTVLTTTTSDGMPLERISQTEHCQISGCIRQSAQFLQAKGHSARSIIGAISRRSGFTATITRLRR